MSPWLSLVLVGGGALLGWQFVKWFDHDEQQQTRIGIERAEWERGRKQIAANMDGRPVWMRRLVKKWDAAGRLGEAKRMK